MNAFFASPSHPSLPTLSAIFSLVCLLVFSPRTTRAQQSCPLPPGLEINPIEDIFTSQQEVELGEILAKRVDRNLHVIHDDELAAYANSVAKRIVEHLPPSHLNVRVMLFDYPVVNALSLPGGRIYVSRKMVAYLQNEDELAALLSHEMGHILTHQSAIQMTTLLRGVLGVNSVGDQKDISDKINLLFDNAARDTKDIERIESEEDRNQYLADWLALYALAGAGYPPRTLMDFFNRFAQTGGKTGNMLSDIFGATSPNQLRLREMQESLESLPTACVQATAQVNEDRFLKWQARVIAYSGSGRIESLTGLKEKIPLDPPLQSDITYLRFSPNGQYALAQDDSSVFVLARYPFKLLFRIHAPDALQSQFSPDSREVIVLTRSLRLETWNIESQERSSIHELAIPGGCLASSVSHNGKMLSCVNADFDFSLYDTKTGGQIFIKKGFFALRGPGWLASLLDTLDNLTPDDEGQVFRLSFSPDDHYIIAAGFDSYQTLAVDILSRSQIPLPHSLSQRLSGKFVFLGPDRIVAIDDSNPKSSAVMEFPSGKIIEKLPIDPRQSLRAPGHGNYLILSPVKDAKAGILDLATQRFILEITSSSIIDVYDQTVLAENSGSELGLYDLSSHRLEALAHIPISPFGRLQSWSASPDFQWLAVSTKSRGAVWNLSTSQQDYLVRGFQGSYFDDNGFFYADFPKKGSQDRTIARASLSGSRFVSGVKVDDKSWARQCGRFLIEFKPAGKNESLATDVVLEVRDARNDDILWTRTFSKEAPRWWATFPYDTLVLSWPADDLASKEEIKGNLALQNRLASSHDRKEIGLVEVLDTATGAVRGQLLIDTGKGSFRILQAHAEGDWLLVSDNMDRIHVYSLTTGERKTTLFGAYATLSAKAGLLIVQNESGQADVYDLTTFEKLNHLSFKDDISAWSFSDDGKRFFVLGSNQEAYIIDTQMLHHLPTAENSLATKK